MQKCRKYTRGKLNDRTVHNWNIHRDQFHQCAMLKPHAESTACMIAVKTSVLYLKFTYINPYLYDKLHTNVYGFSLVEKSTVVIFIDLF